MRFVPAPGRSWRWATLNGRRISFVSMRVQNGRRMRRHPFFCVRGRFRKRETRYYQGALFAFCGKKQAAFHMLQSAVEQNYCAYENLLSDPLLAKLRNDTAFNKVLISARACQDAVRASASVRRH